MDDKKITFQNTEIKKPFKSYDVSEYDELYVDGAEFPLKIKKQFDTEIKEKETRNLKPLVEIKDMWKNFKKEGISLGNTDDEINSNKEKIEELLLHINYYRLSVYRLFLREPRNFHRLYQLYLFDEELRKLISSMLPFIENFLKATLAYSMALEYKNDPDKSCPECLCYLDKEIYKKRNRHSVRKMLSGFADLLNSKQDKDPMIKHHLEYYGGNIPIWVLVEFLTLGDIYTISIHLSRQYRKCWVQQLFRNQKIKDSWLPEWIKTIQLLRNSCAHNARLYGTSPTYNPAIIDEDRESVAQCLENKNIEDIEGYISNQFIHSIFAGILTMKVFYRVSPNEHLKWNIFVAELERIVKDYCISLDYLGFVEDWKAILTI